MSKIHLFALCVTFSLVGCQVTEPNTQVFVDPVYADKAFPYHHNVAIESEEEIFALSEPMEQLVREISREPSSKDRVSELVSFLFESDQIGINYNSSANLTARETFYSQNANCMSLTVLSYALAKAADLPAYFQRVDVPEYWVRNGSYNMLTGHVNLVIFDADRPLAQTVYGKNVYTIDFDPTMRKQAFPSEFVDKNTIMAMFYTNKGADAMVIGDTNKAYAYLKAATLIDPFYDSAWGNLGVLYRQNNLPEQALKVYQNALDINADNLTVLDNMAILYELSGNVTQAQHIRESVHSKRLKNPYYHALLGTEAYYNGEYLAAVNHYKKAIRLDNKQHEFYFGIAKAYAELGELDQVKRSLERAKNYATYNDDELRYDAKIQFLNTARL
ncbi:tetratricopeptide repeat protein [Thalassotalea sp. LPB0316]|uniref:tetratricopeptide repeat protein n=1 Tax=Thalassotalea sp. LPB0316 TaxID=2769490 RepID=UPI0018677C53|nr:tetratricopeptide repeat protein [Thalassotalea sp. LPB0316]QOL25102.1 tetratricopeptide repeat protein [Thalassotalea sp. LPB0316]